MTPAPTQSSRARARAQAWRWSCSALATIRTIVERALTHHLRLVGFTRGDHNMSAPLPKRILKETERLVSDSPPGIIAVPTEDNLRHFDILIDGPDQSAYAGGKFKLELFLPEEYPMVAPKVRFLTKIYHPNIDRLGRICMDTLKSANLACPPLHIDDCCTDREVFGQTRGRRHCRSGRSCSASRLC